MIEQDGTVSSTEQLRSRKTNTNKQNGKQAPVSQHPSNDDIEAWKTYWKQQGQPWRTEPVIDIKRQKYLDERRAIVSDIEQGRYPFKDIEPKLTRADIEWLLATHENGLGPVDWSDVNQRGRIGVDLRGADLYKLDLNHLPLARMRGGLTAQEWSTVTKEQRDMIAIHLQEANLVGAQMQEANLAGAGLQEANLKKAQLLGADLRGALMQEADLDEAQLQGAILQGAKLQKANLVYAQMQKADLWQAQMQEVDLRWAQMQEANLCQARLQKANLKEAQMQKAKLMSAGLQEANLPGAQLQEAILQGARLQNTDLRSAQLQRAYLGEAQLQGADLRMAELDHAYLDQVTFSDQENGSARFADITWGDVNLAVVDWRHVTRLGDEQVAHQKKDIQRNTKYKQSLVDEYKAAVRANRQLAVVLRDQGLNEEADHFAYRAQLLQRVVWHLQRRPLKFVLSWFLYLLAGYGYSPGRSIVWYLVVIIVFALTYHALGGLTLFPPDAFFFSIMSFHGRGFFPSLSGETNLHNPLVMLAAFEAIVGLIIEISFIATFTQRFFGK